MDSATALMTSNILADFSDIRSHNKVDDVKQYVRSIGHGMLLSHVVPEPHKLLGFAYACSPAQFSLNESLGGLAQLVTLVVDGA